MTGHEDAALRAAYLVLRDPDDAADAAQEGFVRAYRGIGRFQTGRLFRPWLLRIVVNEALNMHKAKRRRTALAEQLGAAYRPPDVRVEESVIERERALALWAPGREAVADFFDRLRIFQTVESPAGLPTEIEGEPVSPAEAEQRLGFPLKRPAYPKGLELKQTLLQEFPGFVAAVLLYERPSGPGFALFETRGAVGKGLPEEGEPLEPPASAEPVAGLGDEAYWLEGLRIVEYYDEQGGLIRESRRATDANTLLWDEGGFVFRLEGDLSKEEAIRIAQSLR